MTTVGVFRPKSAKYGGSFTNSYYRNPEFCCRITPESFCFCGMPFYAHDPNLANMGRTSMRNFWEDNLRNKRQSGFPPNQGCCGKFRYMPDGEFSFCGGPLQTFSGNIAVKKVGMSMIKNGSLTGSGIKCRNCNEPPEAHDPVSESCRKGMRSFSSAWECKVCNQPWEAHETVLEGDDVYIPSHIAGISQSRNANGVVVPFRRDDFGVPAAVHKGRNFRDAVSSGLDGSFNDRCAFVGNDFYGDNPMMLNESWYPNSSGSRSYSSNNISNQSLSRSSLSKSNVSMRRSMSANRLSDRSGDFRNRNDQFLVTAPRRNIKPREQMIMQARNTGAIPNDVAYLYPVRGEVEFFNAGSNDWMKTNDMPVNPHDLSGKYGGGLARSQSAVRMRF